MPELKPTVYVETTVPSYLTAWPSNDVVRAAHQQITREWWRHAPPRFRLVVSEAVVSEVGFGDAKAAAERVQAIAGLPVLAINEDVRSLVQAYHNASLVPAKASGDLLHFAFSVAFAAETSLARM